jgi:hypothetical protein
MGARDSPVVIVRLPRPSAGAALCLYLRQEATLNCVLFAQAYLKLDGTYEDWVSDASRQNVRNGIRRAFSNGMSTRSVSVDQTYEMYLSVERDRGAAWSPSALPLLENSPSLADHLTVGTWNADGVLVAMVYGVRAGNVLKFCLAVGSTKSDGARWLCFAEFIRVARDQGVDTFLVESRVDLAPGLIHFQNMFGFETRTLLLA